MSRPTDTGETDETGDTVTADEYERSPELYDHREQHTRSRVLRNASGGGL